jgi:hypothetical protein
MSAISGPRAVECTGTVRLGQLLNNNIVVRPSGLSPITLVFGGLAPESERPF